MSVSLIWCLVIPYVASCLPIVLYMALGGEFCKYGVPSVLSRIAFTIGLVYTFPFWLLVLSFAFVSDVLLPYIIRKIKHESP